MLAPFFSLPLVLPLQQGGRPCGESGFSNMEFEYRWPPQSHSVIPRSLQNKGQTPKYSSQGLTPPPHPTHPLLFLPLHSRRCTVSWWSTLSIIFLLFSLPRIVLLDLPWASGYLLLQDWWEPTPSSLLWTPHSLGQCRYCSPVLSNTLCRLHRGNHHSASPQHVCLSFH